MTAGFVCQCGGAIKDLALHFGADPQSGKFTTTCTRLTRGQISMLADPRQQLQTDTPPQELIEKAWDQYAEAQNIHTSRERTQREMYGMFEAAFLMGWSLRGEQCAS